MSTKRLAVDVLGRRGVGRGGKMATVAVRPCQCFRYSAPPPFARDAQLVDLLHRHRAAWYSSSSQSQEAHHQQLNFTKTSLKKTMRPFLRACHPDAIAAMVDKKHPLSKQAKEVNLSAIQTVNGLIDALEEMIARCIPPSYKQDKTNFRSGSLPELKSRYEVEFILPFSHRLEADSTEQPDEKDLTRRSVMISFPRELRTSARKWALTIFPTHQKTEFDEHHRQEAEALQTATNLRNHAAHEFVRLLKIAGLDVPTLSAEMEPQHLQHKSEDQWTLSDQFLHELGVDPSSEETISNARSHVNAFFGRGQTQTAKGVTGPAPLAYSNPHLQQQRQAFMDSVDFSSFRDKYDQAFLDAQADYTTDKLDLYNYNTPEGRERRERFVSDICSTARIMRSPVESSSGEDEYMDIPEGLDVVHQLVAIRRLSALLYDNFEYLQLEQYGRLWENVTIVLVPPRPDGRKYKSNVFNPDDHQTRKKASKWKRRLKKREKGSRAASRDAMRYIAKTCNGGSKNDDDDVDDEPLPETGFKFSYGSVSDQSVGHATAYIPIDFGDEELIHMLHRHVHDYFDSVLGTDPVFDYPRYDRKDTVQSRRRLSA
mmetsp:Transcript_35690/g.80182  ORF Transcript_35690/g.80182 Transcript_35690/m.80182 type:complete len:597 (+) Transcript_35690:170-1960(+)